MPATRAAAPPPADRLPAIPVRGAVPCLERGCSACCHDTEMLLTEDDVVRISAARPGVAFHAQAADGYLQLLTRDGPPAPGGKGRPCVFLAGDGRCSIHALRPEGCRLYPALWSDDDGRAQLDAAHCPHTDGFVLAPATADAVRRLAARLHAERDARLGAA